MSATGPEGQDNIVQLPQARHPPSAMPATITGLAMSTKPLAWLDGGALERWVPVPIAGRRRRASTGPQIALTEIADPSRSETAQRWLSLQRFLVVPHAPHERRRNLVFWRIALHNHAFALAATACTDAATARDQIEQIRRNAARLEVSFGYSETQVAPYWVAHADGVPAFVGLPDHQLAVTSHPETGLAGILAQATYQTYIHQSGNTAEASIAEPVRGPIPLHASNPN